MARYSTAGLLLQININGNFTNIDGVESVGGPSGDKPEIDLTSLADSAAETAGGIPDFGEVSVSMFDNPADPGNARILTRMNTTPAPIDNWKIILPFSGSGNTLAFNGFVKSNPFDFQKAAGGKQNFTIRCTGTVART